MTRITLALVALLGLVACETVKGAGQDIENAGEAIQSESAEAQYGS
ncbi:MAG: entericidin A/B family lipoprotein [Paracoccaceae bacterium]